jgi:type I restriction enzyme, S subunit
LFPITVALPPFGEQFRIITEIERRFSIIDELESIITANLKRAERLRQSILKRAFEGKLVPQDPKDEPASVLLERIRAERAERGGLQEAAKKITNRHNGKSKKKPPMLETQGELFR